VLSTLTDVIEHVTLALKLLVETSTSWQLLDEQPVTDFCGPAETDTVGAGAATVVPDQVAVADALPLFEASLAVSV
jgi:hypothetical protein